MATQVQSLACTDARDTDLERRVKIYLANRHVPGLLRLAVEAHEGTVTMSGNVATFYQKQLVQACCRRVAGVRELIDDTIVA